MSTVTMEDVSDTINPADKTLSSSSGADSEAKEISDDTSTKATEENDSDTTMETKKDAGSDVETDVDDAGSATAAAAATGEDSRTQEEKDQEAKEKEEAEKKRIEELKIKYKDWPLKDIKEPHENDVMYGRGGGTNHHPGNKRYRKMVESRKVKYVNSKRLDKPLVALEIIREWRAQLPPGRFLKHNDKTGNWDDVGDKKAREKTSQALREKAPQIRAQQEEEQEGGNDTGDKTTRFAAGTKGNKKQNGKIKKAILARDHSLGREYLAPEENVDLEGFTWVQGGGGGKEASIGATSAGSNGVVLPPGRESSMGSVSSWFSNIGPGPQPSVPDFHGRVAFGEPRREYSNSSIASFGQPYIPVPPGAPHHQRSGSWTHPPPPPPPPHGPYHQRSGSWNGGREHSFSMNPLQYTRINQPAPMGAFDHRPGSGSWGPQYPPPGPPSGPPPGPQHYHAPPPPGVPPPPPSPSAYGPFAYQSGSSMGTIGSVGSPHRGPYRNGPSSNTTPSPPYDAMGIAKTWSEGGTPPPPGSFGHSQYDDQVPGPDSTNTPPRGGPPEAQHGRALPRPAMVKRDTSNQNESYETKPSRIKKAALNRDQSATSNRLKQQYIPEVFNKDMQSLNQKTEKIRLSSPVPDSSASVVPKPAPLDLAARQTTVEAMESCMQDFLMKTGPPQPSRLTQEDRKNTMDELGYDLIGDSDLQKNPTPPTLSKPPKLTSADRLTTSEFNEIVNAPFLTDGKTDGDDENPLPY